MPGYRRLFTRWLIADIAVGALLAWAVPQDLQTSANTILLPLAGILVGLSFAWGGNAQALLATQELEEMSKYVAGGFEEWVYAFMLAILLVLSSLTIWGLAGLGVIDRPSPIPWGHRLYPLVKCVYFAIASMTIRECWQVVSISQLLLIARRRIRSSRHEKPADKL